MDLLEALYTTRAMRRVSADPVDPEDVALVLDAAIRAPSGGNSQNWRMMVVDDPELRARLGPVYRRAFEQLQNTVYKRSWEKARETGNEPAPACDALIRLAGRELRAGAHLVLFLQPQ